MDFSVVQLFILFLYLSIHSYYVCLCVYHLSVCLSISLDAIKMWSLSLPPIHPHDSTSTATRSQSDGQTDKQTD